MSTTKERILETALALFAERGYAGTSMSDLAGALGITKGALYRHYAGKEAIFAAIIARMEALDAERAQAFAMPTAVPGSGDDAYRRTAWESVRAYSVAQFRYWTEERFPSRFRRLLTLEQYRDPKMARLFRDYLSAGPLVYMTELFRSAHGGAAERLALDFYGPMFLLYSVYDGAEDKTAVLPLLEMHLEAFEKRLGNADPAGSPETDRSFDNA